MRAGNSSNKKQKKTDKKNDKKKNNEKNKKKDYNPEKTIKEEKRPIPVNEIIEKSDTICKILKGNEEGSGFFCKINIKGKEMKVLFTNNHVLNENNIKPNSIIEIQQNNNKYQIKITEDRFISTNEDLDYTCIQIFDYEPYNNYLIIDNKINNENYFEYHLKFVENKFLYYINL